MSSGTINAEQVRLQPASPAQPDVAAELIHATDPHIFGYLHQHDWALTVSHLGHQWQQPGTLFSHDFCTAAVTVDGELAGIELGYDARQREQAGATFVEVAMAWLDEPQFAHLAGWAEYGSYVLPPVPDDAWYLQHLAVVGAARGRGIGERLLSNAIERERAAGHARIQLDLYAGNPAQRLYERMGFRVIVETRVPPLVPDGIDLHLRMERKF